MLDQCLVFLLALARFTLFPRIVTAAGDTQQNTHTLHRIGLLMSPDKSIAHLPSLEYITSTFFRISLSCLSSAFSRSSCRICASVSVKLPFPGKASPYFGSRSCASFHFPSSPLVIPNSCSISIFERSPFSYIRMASSLNSLL